MTILYFLKLASFAAPLVFLAAILAFWIKHKTVNLKLLKIGIAITVILFIIENAYGTIVTYGLWKNDPVSRYLLPPYEKAYFYQYAYFHFWRKDVMALLASLMWAGVLLIISKYSNNRILDKSDVSLGFFTAFAAGWPGFAVYITISLGLLAAYQIINVFVFKKNGYVAITASLIASSLVVLFLGEYLINYLNLGVLRV